MGGPVGSVGSLASETEVVGSVLGRRQMNVMSVVFVSVCLHVYKYVYQLPSLGRNSRICRIIAVIEAFSLPRAKVKLVNGFLLIYLLILITNKFLL